MKFRSGEIEHNETGRIKMRTRAHFDVNVMPDQGRLLSKQAPNLPWSKKQQFSWVVSCFCLRACFWNGQKKD